MHQHGHHRDGWIMTHDIEKTVRGGIGPTIPSESCDQRDRSGYDRAEQQLVTVRWCHSVDVELHKAPPKNVILCSSGPAGNVPLGSKCEELALSIRLPLCPPMADITQTWVALLDRARRRHRASRDSYTAFAALLTRSEEHTSELQSLRHLVCRLLLEKKKSKQKSSKLLS